jgi:hypothetical protein
VAAYYSTIIGTVLILDKRVVSVSIMFLLVFGVLAINVVGWYFRDIVVYVLDRDYPDVHWTDIEGQP